MRRDKQAQEDLKLTAEIRVYCDPLLKDLAGKAADEKQLPLSEFVVQVLAEYLERPELAHVPRKPMGRPRNQLAS